MAVGNVYVGPVVEKSRVQCGEPVVIQGGIAPNVAFQTEGAIGGVVGGNEGQAGGGDATGPCRRRREFRGITAIDIDQVVARRSIQLMRRLVPKR